MEIVQINEDSDYLPKVIRLWRRNSRTLGYFPEGAFVDHARRGCILVAFDEREALLGYLLFRIATRGGAFPQATIVHLCVDRRYRGEGVARQLYEEFRSVVNDKCLSITLSCRRDYDASSLWPKLGFVYSGERTGRSGCPIVTWRLNLRPLPLDALLYETQSAHRLSAVIDANILYRLQDPVPTHRDGSRVLSEEAKSVQEDWLNSDIRLLITDETFNEIERSDDARRRNRRLAFARQFPRVVSDLELVESLYQQLHALFPEEVSASTASDIKQLAHAIAGNTSFFVTQDSGLLKRTDAIRDQYGIRVLSPGELIGRIDEVVREAEYQPDRLAGSRVLVSRLRSNQMTDLYQSFGCPALREKKSQLESQLRSYLAQPDLYECSVSYEQGGNPLSLIVYDRSSPDELAVPVIRVSESPLSPTILRHLVSDAVLVSAREQRLVTRVTEEYPTKELVPTLKEMAFMQSECGWIKINLSLACPTALLVDYLDQAGSQCPSVRPYCRALTELALNASRNQEISALAEIENALWPLKIVDAGIPSYLISIKPVWAQHLFDEGIASQTLWGANEELALRNENVYYRSKRNSRNIRSPARILWYVTHDPRHRGSKHVRACSFLDEVVVGGPKHLFRRFKRLGVYGWEDLMEITDGDPSREIMALRFSHTELLRRPISYEELVQIFDEIEEKAPVLQSPQLVSREAFARIYETGTSSDN